MSLLISKAANATLANTKHPTMQHRVIRHGAIALAMCALCSGVAQAQRISTLEVLAPGSLKTTPNLGKFPAGLKVRADTVLPRSAGDTTAVTVGGGGWNVRSGPSSILWKPKNTASGSFIISGLFYLAMARTRDTPAYGVFFGGKEMGTPNARYTEFLINNDSKFSVRQHVGSKVTVVKDWTKIAGIQLQRGKYDELAGNRFRVIVDKEIVQFVVNRAVAYSMLRPTASPDGVFGARVGTDQDVILASLELEKAGASQEIPPLKYLPMAPQKPAQKMPVKPPVKPAGVPAGTRQG
jgi:hypothetical protein